MTRAIENPVTGERIEFRERTDGALLFEYYLEPGGFAVGRFDHVHPRQSEQLEIRSGQLDVRIDGDEWTATAGTRFAIPPGTPHTIWNAGDERMHATIELSPALDAKSFFETTFGLARDGETNHWGLPGPLQLAVLVDEFHEEFYFAGAPRAAPAWGRGRPRADRPADGLPAKISAVRRLRVATPDRPTSASRANRATVGASIDLDAVGTTGIVRLRWRS